MKKRLISAGLTLALALAAALPVVNAADITMEKFGKEVTATQQITNPCNFTDATQIFHWDAVSFLSIWGVIAGKSSGAFAPAATVTRAEMAKMLCAIRFGGHDLVEPPAEGYIFRDTQGHWAESYIADCAEQGMIEGRGDGLFDPDAPVTAAEAAKMILVLLGYDPTAFGLAGETWKVNTLTLSSALFVGIVILEPDEPLCRDDAAQMLYNALNSHPMEVVGEEHSEETGETTYVYAPDRAYFMVKAYGGILGPGPDRPWPEGDENI